jgi:hypothetical protein
MQNLKPFNGMHLESVVTDPKVVELAFCEVHACLGVFAAVCR